MQSIISINKKIEAVEDNPGLDLKSYKYAQEEGPDFIEKYRQPMRKLEDKKRHISELL